MNFELGNPQQDAPKRIKKRQLPHGKLKTLTLVLALVLTAVMLFALLDRTAFDGLRRSVAYLRAQKDETGCAQLYSYSGTGSDCYALLDGSLLVASEQEITLLGENGGAIYHTALQFSKVAVTACDDWAIAYDIGGRELYLFTGKGLVKQLTLEGEVYAVQMGRDGRFAVTLKKSGYKTAACVYNGKGELLYVFNSAENYLMTAAVSDNGKYLASAAMSQNEGSFVSSLLLHRLNSDSLTASGVLDGGVYTLGSVDGRFCAATEKALCFVKTDGSVASYDFESATLSRCSLGGGSFAAVVLENYRSGGRTHLVTVDTAGEELASAEAAGEVLDISASGRYLAVLYSDKLVIYDRKLQECSVLEDVSSARRVLMRADGSAVLVGTNSASLYLP